MTIYNLKVNNQLLNLRVIKTPKQLGDFDTHKPTWDLQVQFPDKTKVIYRRVFWYESGWSQGTNRSTRGYYFTILGLGSASNGSGISAQCTPYLYDSHLERIKSILDKTHYSQDSIKLWESCKESLTK